MGVPWSNPPSTPTLDWTNPPWSNPPSTPTLDWANGGADLPPEVSAAIGRFRMQAFTDRDRQVITEFLVNNGDSLTANEQMALGDIIHAMDSGNMVSQTPAPAVDPGHPPDVATMRAAAGLSAPANLPTPQPPPLSPTPQIPSSPNDPIMRGPSPGGLASAPNVASLRSAPTNLPTPTPSPVSPMPAGGYGASNLLARAGRQQARGDARGGQNWKLIEDMGPNSAFADVSPEYRQAYADSPAMASRELSGPNADITARAREPMVSSALAMAASGLLGGGHGHGLGGPGSASAKLGRAEGLLNSLGPGGYIDPGSVLHQTLRRARKTPIDKLYSGQGDPNDITQQIDTTNQAILKPLEGVTDPDAYNGLQAVLQQESMNWLQAVAHGEIDPNTMSYPEWLRQHKMQKFLGR